MNEPVKTKQIGNYTINVYYDEMSCNPRLEWDNASHMVVRSRYLEVESNEVEQTINSLCNKYGIENEDMGFLEVIEALNEHIVIKPISLYVHSGMTVWYGSPTCRWDSGYIGFGYMEHEDLYSSVCDRDKKHYPNWRDQCEAVMGGEMDVLDRCLRGEVYGYVIEDMDGEHIDSCWGFYEDAEEVMKEAEEMIPEEVVELEELYEMA